VYTAPTFKYIATDAVDVDVEAIDRPTISTFGMHTNGDASEELPAINSRYLPALAAPPYPQITGATPENVEAEVTERVHSPAEVLFRYKTNFALALLFKTKGSLPPYDLTVICAVE
jgi:hypothetical protein